MAESFLLSRRHKLKDILYAFYRRIYTKFWWRWPELLQPPRTPHIVSLELTNDCNLKCPHCPRQLMNRRIGYMDFHIFKRIVEEISSYSWCFLRIVGLGEPAMHPRIKEILDYLANRPFKIEFTTNGTLLMRFPPEEILNWHIDILSISIDGFDAASYSRYRPNGDYNALRAKTIEFFNTRRKMAAKFPKIRIRNVVFPGTTLKQIRAFTENWLPFADMVTFNTPIAKRKYEPARKLERCEDILFTIHIRWDGRVPLCGYQLWCGDIEWLGDLHDFSLRDLWYKDRLLEVRKCHAAGDFAGIEFCKYCFYSQRRKRILDTTEAHDRHRKPGLSKIYRFAIRALRFSLN